MINIDLIPTHSKDSEDYAMWHGEIYRYSSALGTWQPTSYDTLDSPEFIDLNHQYQLSNSMPPCILFNSQDNTALHRVTMHDVGVTWESYNPSDSSWQLVESEHMHHYLTNKMATGGIVARPIAVYPKPVGAS